MIIVMGQTKHLHGLVNRRAPRGMNHQFLKAEQRNTNLISHWPRSGCTYHWSSFWLPVKGLFVSVTLTKKRESLHEEALRNYASIYTC